MKKNILRVISLVLVAVMLFAFTSCTQEVLIRFVDSEGEDIDFEKIFGGNSGVATGNQGIPTDPTNAPAEVTTSGGSDVTSAPNDNVTPTSAPTTPNAGTPAEKPTSAPQSAVPSGKEAVFNFYKTAANAIKNNGVAGYDKLEFQTISNLNLSGISMVDNAIAGVVGKYMKTEEQAEVETIEKGSDNAKSLFPGCKLSDLSKVASANCEKLSNGNYKITIIMQNEDTPTTSNNFLGEVTNSILYWDDLEKELANIDIIKSYSDIHLIYEGYRIEAEMTPAGQFVSLLHASTVNAKIGSAKIIVATLKDKSGTIYNTAKYSNFKY